jgi:hypothetical protein
MNRKCWSVFNGLGLRIGTNQDRFLGGFLKLSDAESVNFHCVPNQVLYQAEPLPDCYHLHSTIVYVTRPRSLGSTDRVVGTNEVTGQ